MARNAAGEKLTELDRLNASGYAFQLAVKQVIEQSDSDWVVGAVEHPWQDEESEGYGDIIITNGGMRIVIECKRVKDTTWQFVSTLQNQNFGHTQRFLTFLPEPGRKNHIIWKDYHCDLDAYEAIFSIVRGQANNDDTPMLEKTAKTLLRATEALAVEESKASKDLCLYIPVIITSAPIKLCFLDPKKVDISTGTIKNCEFEDVPFVCFRKPIITQFEFETRQRDPFIKYSNLNSERGVYVVNSLSIDKFLKEFQIRELR
jgi:hypothetical protein